MLRFAADELDIRFLFLDNFPDYRMDLPGAKSGGRTIEPDLSTSKKAWERWLNTFVLTVATHTLRRNTKIMPSLSSHGTICKNVRSKVLLLKATHSLQCYLRHVNIRRDVCT